MLLVEFKGRLNRSDENVDLFKEDVIVFFDGSGFFHTEGGGTIATEGLVMNVNGEEGGEWLVVRCPLTIWAKVGLMS